MAPGNTSYQINNVPYYSYLKEDMKSVISPYNMDDKTPLYRQISKMEVKINDFKNVVKSFDETKSSYGEDANNKISNIGHAGIDAFAAKVGDDEAREATSEEIKEERIFSSESETLHDTSKVGRSTEYVSQNMNTDNNPFIDSRLDSLCEVDLRNIILDFRSIDLANTNFGDCVPDTELEKLPSETVEDVRVGPDAKEDSELRQRQGVHFELTIANCFNVFEIAKQIMNLPLLKLVDDFVRENVSEILETSSLTSLSITDFIGFLTLSSLGDPDKHKLMESKMGLRSIKFGFDKAFTKSAIDSFNIIAELLKMCSEFPFLKMYCCTLLGESICNENCFETAVLANRYDLKPLKILAECHIIENYDAIKLCISSKSYSNGTIKRYLDLSSLPLYLKYAIAANFAATFTLKDSFRIPQHLTILMRDDVVNKIRDPVKGLSEEDLQYSEDWQVMKTTLEQCEVAIERLDSHEWFLSQMCKLKTRKTKVIDNKGGKIELNGCSISIPPKALQHPTPITISLCTDPDSFPSQGFAITPILGVVPSVIFEQQVLVTMRTCFRSSENKTVHAQIFRRKSASDWKTVSEVSNIKLGRNYEIKFYTKHFCDITAVVDPDQSTSGEVLVRNDVYIRRQTGTITSYFYIRESDEHNIFLSMLRGYSKKFCSKVLEIHGCKAGDMLSVHIELESPEIKISSTSWKPTNETSVESLMRDGRWSAQAKPGICVRDLKPESFVDGEVKIIMNGHIEKDSAFLDTTWPIEIDHKEFLAQVSTTYHSYNQISGTIGTLVKDNGQLTEAHTNSYKSINNAS